MNNQDIQIFLTVVRCRNFSQAASLLYSTQTTVSHRIAALEKELGYPLLIRRQGFRAVELTPQGEQFVPLAEQWMALWDSSIAIKDSEHKPNLTIGATNRLNAYFLPPFFTHFAQTTPTIKMNIRSYHSAEVVDLISRKELDFGFVSNTTYLKDVTVQPFLKENVVMICRQGDYYKDEFIHPYSLNPQHEVHLASNPEIDSWHDHWWSRHHKPYVYVDTATLAVHHLTEPSFWTVCPYSVAKSLQSLYQIDIHQFSTEVPSQMSYLVYHPFPRPDKALLIDTFKNAFKQYFLSKEIAGFLL